MDRADIPFLSASDLSRLIERKEVSPVEVVEAYLERIDQVDGKLNSYVTVSRDQARRAAREAEQAIMGGGYLGPMHGIPYAVKDQMWTKGIRTTNGSSILADFVPDEDSTVIANLKKAGAILLGKLNMEEFAMSDHYSHPFGIPHNPWDLTRSPGASSSGSGAATAGFLCATALGEDTGGSIRGPANNCGLVALRPSWGRVSRYGVFGGCWSTDTVGAISRTAEDCAITFQAIAGYDPKDSYTWNVPVPDYRKALDGNIKGVRVGVVKEAFEEGLIEPETQALVEKAIAFLGELGAVVEDVSLPYSKSGMMGYATAQYAALHYKTLFHRLDELDPTTQVMFLTGALMPAQAYYKSQKIRTLFRRQIFELLERVDVMVLPTAKGPAATLGEVRSFGSKEQVVAGLTRGRFSGASPAAGIPALSVPCGFTSENLPVGLQIVGRLFDEATVLKVAHAYEQNTPWHTRKPAI